MNKKKAQSRFVFACLAPAVILVFIFMVIPTIDVFKTAFFKKSNFVSEATFADSLTSKFFLTICDLSRLCKIQFFMSY